MNKRTKTTISDIDLEKMAEKIADQPGLLPYAHQAGSAIVKPEDKGKITGKAVAAMHSQTEMQMAQLYAQMQLLADQAKSIQQRVEVSERIYLADISFEPLINHVYYLYLRENGKDFLSMVSPQEWGRKIPFEKFVAKVRLLADHTWEIIREDS